jgi:sugar phosphate isomerase/epimerase
MSREHHRDIRIGTLAPLKAGLDYLRQILPHGFESFQLTLGQHVGEANLPEIAKEILETLGDEAVISSLGIYGNPLQDEKCASDWEVVVRSARHFGCNVVCGFAGALEDRSVDQSMGRFGEVFGQIAKVAADEGVRIGFENCDMGGTWEKPRWNIAHSPRAWEMMFDAVPGDTLGLEWEPCHQMVSLIDPIPQLRKWAGKVVHVHGKDATVAWDVVETEGIRSGRQYVWHRTPGFGDTNWADVITILRMAGFEGAIDIEGWHDPIYRDELEMTGQVHGLGYLQSCRGGDFVENPRTSKG